MAFERVLVIVGLTALASMASYAGYQAYKTHESESQDWLKVHTPEIEHLRHRVGEFQEWQKKFNKVYSDIEGPIRFQIWNEIYDRVEAHNAQNLTWELEMNAFSDLTDEEFTALHTGFLGEEAMKEPQDNVYIFSEEEELEANLTDSWDWRTKGAVAMIRNQGQCGGCWSFSAAAALEGIYDIRKNKLWALSKQQQIDCSSSYGNQGCNGGLMNNAFKYTRDKGIEKEGDYPYQARQGSCRYSSSKVLFKNKGYYQVSRNSPTALKTATRKQPVAVGVQSDQSAFRNYRSGIISSGCGANLNHAITIVGYGTSGSTNYWIVKNSWGTSWGEKGYVRIAMGTQNNGAGVCGINAAASYPTY